MNNSLVSLQSPAEVAADLAERARALRLTRNWTRQTLAARAGVTLASLRRFETSGKASLELVLKVAYALDRLGEVDALLRPPRARSIDELEALEAQSARPIRKRGRR